MGDYNTGGTGATLFQSGGAPPPSKPKLNQQVSNTPKLEFEPAPYRSCLIELKK